MKFKRCRLKMRLVISKNKAKKPANRYFSQHENAKINEIYPDIVDLPIFNDAS